MRTILPVAGLATLVLAGAAVVLTGCSPQRVAGCTRIGCSSGASLQLDGELPDSYMVTLYAPGEGPRVVECAPAQQCGGRVFFEGVTARDVEVEIAGEAGMRQRYHVSLSYTTVQPNGPDCPPTCSQAFARVQLH